MLCSGGMSCPHLAHVTAAGPVQCRAGQLSVTASGLLVCPPLRVPPASCRTGPAAVTATGGPLTTHAPRRRAPTARAGRGRPRREPSAPPGCHPAAVRSARCCDWWGGWGPALPLVSRRTVRCGPVRLRVDEPAYAMGERPV